MAKTVDCRRIRLAVFGDSRRFRRQIVAENGDYSLQCGQGLMGRYLVYMHKKQAYP